MAVSQAFMFHFKYYSILHFAVCELLGWDFLYYYRSIVQESEIGLMLFIILMADLRPGGESNRIVKYADDASLLVPENTYMCI